ncbi:SubName: Full=Uncharacterized protein {ECO:0000313/EMBL:CCA72774.1} [Serendipita indica DSM 11827]|uniref:DRBM domain-containing protein n=1 Tax=Serendipita indica (strain DSM 11827) TaxID=1109443 RepID=G4TN76_SERID|nr:SubName: Full=Uncharacterized protein {ECO:0000313/EMBL:CCA72774.1} [Serendipita indica DSM 11827]CCA72774.1 hypothetical protein PIIN_06712 [Serendipita indica DSM 11827]
MPAESSNAQDPRQEVEEIKNQNKLDVTFNDDNNVGNDTNAMWECIYYYNGDEIGVARATSKQEAKRLAAIQARDKLNRMGYYRQSKKSSKAQ